MQVDGLRKLVVFPTYSRRIITSRLIFAYKTRDALEYPRITRTQLVSARFVDAMVVSRE